VNTASRLMSKAAGAYPSFRQFTRAELTGNFDLKKLEPLTVRWQS